MIEIEKKFLLDEAARRRLLEGAQFLQEVIIHDIYYDTADFQLTKQDNWLRNRNGKFELKMALTGEKAKSSQPVSTYKEIASDTGIRKELKIKLSSDLETDLLARGYKPYARWTNTRRKYTKDGFNIDVDSLDFGYEVVEIELMVESPADADSAAKKIIDFATQNGLALDYVYGKNAEYLRRFSPIHFQALVEAGVVPEN